MEIDVIALALEDMGRWDSQLLELVKEEKIDPWDIDIALLTGKYLERINGMASLDFRIPGKAVITAAVLLRMKSERLMERRADEAHVREAGGAGAIKYAAVPELVPVRRVVERKITLLELVEALRGAFEVEKKKIQRKRVLGQLIKISAFDMTQLIDGIKLALSEIFRDRESVSLAELPSKEEFTLLFLALLHLATEGFLALGQDDWNSEIIVMRPVGGAASS